MTQYRQLNICPLYPTSCWMWCFSCLHTTFRQRPQESLFASSAFLLSYFFLSRALSFIFHWIFLSFTPMILVTLYFTLPRAVLDSPVVLRWARWGQGVSRTRWVTSWLLRVLLDASGCGLAWHAAVKLAFFSCHHTVLSA